MESGEIICSTILVAWTIRNLKIKLGKEKSPSCFSGVQTLGFVEILKILMISEDSKWMTCTSKPVPPFLEL